MSADEGGEGTHTAGEVSDSYISEADAFKESEPLCICGLYSAPVSEEQVFELSAEEDKEETSSDGTDDGDILDDRDSETVNEILSFDDENSTNIDTSVTLCTITEPMTDSVPPIYGNSSAIDMDSDSTKSSCLDNNADYDAQIHAELQIGSADDADTSSAADIHAADIHADTKDNYVETRETYNNDVFTDLPIFETEVFEIAEPVTDSADDPIDQISGTQATEISEPVTDVVGESEMPFFEIDPFEFAKPVTDNAGKPAEPVSGNGGYEDAKPATDGTAEPAIPASQTETGGPVIDGAGETDMPFFEIDPFEDVLPVTEDADEHVMPVFESNHLMKAAVVTGEDPAADQGEDSLLAGVETGILQALSIDETMPDTQEELTGAAGWKSYYNAATEFGANGGDSKADEKALRSALHTAGLAAQSLKKMVEVFVPKGLYHLKDTLFIFSDIWLHLADGAVMYRDDPSKVMLLGVYLDRDGNIVHSEDYKVGGYDQIKNVKISGGEWNGGAVPSDAYAKTSSKMEFVFRHGENITIEDTTVGNDTATHTMNFDGCRNLTIRNVKFVNHYKYEGPDPEYFMGVSRKSDTAYAYKEALHTDFLAASDTGSNAKPIENLGMSSIVVSDCTFRNVVAGLGTHHTHNGVYADGYKVQNCTFRDIPYICINARNFRDFVCDGNTATNVNCFLQGYNLSSKKNSASYIMGNTIIGKKFSGVTAAPMIEIRDKSKVLVVNNLLSSAQADGIRLYVDGQQGRTASAVLQAEIMQNSFYNGVGKGSGTSECAAIKALPGVKLTTWQNLIYLKGSPSASKVYGIYMYRCSDGCRLSTDYISGGTTGIYVNTLNNLAIRQSEIIQSKENGIFAAHINGLSLIGAKITSGLKNGLYICHSTNVKNSKSLALWTRGTDLILYNLYNSKDLSSFATFIAGNSLSSGVRIPFKLYREGDVNFDGKVTFADLSALESLVRGNSLLAPATLYMADLSNDKIVNQTDVSLLRTILSA